MFDIIPPEEIQTSEILGINDLIMKYFFVCFSFLLVH